MTHVLVVDGIGLTIARAAVEAMGGRIWAESDGAGRGSTFRFSLPVRMRQQSTEALPEVSSLLAVVAQPEARVVAAIRAALAEQKGTHA